MSRIGHECQPDNITEEVHFSWTVGKAEDSLVLSSKSDEVLHGRLRTPLSHCSEELSTLGEANGIVTLLQLRVAHLRNALKVRMTRSILLAI